MCQLWDNKSQIRQEPGKLTVPSQAGGEFAAELLRGATKGLFNLGRKGASEAVKSNYAKQKIKSIANQYLDQALDRFTSDLSNKLDPVSGKGIDIHKAILKVAPKKGFVMPGHNYTGPGNPLEQQLSYDPNTGQILEIYQQPTGKTDAVSMQHDVDYSVCASKSKSNQVKCKNDADRKMVKALDAIPWKDRQWGHAVARNAIATKSKLGMGSKKPKKGKSCCLECAIASEPKLGMGVKKSKNGKSRRVKKIGK